MVDFSQPLNLLPQYPPLLSFAWSISFWMSILGLVFIFYRRITSLNNRRTLVLWKDGTHTIKDYKIKDGKLQIRKTSRLRKDESKEWTPTVKSENVIPAKRTFRGMIKPVGFKQKDLFIAVEDSPELVSIKGAVEFKEGQDPEFKSSILLKTWSKEEIAQYIKKALAKGIVQRKVFSDSQFYMFLFIQMACLFLLIFMIRAMGIL